MAPRQLRQVPMRLTKKTVHMCGVYMSYIYSKVEPTGLINSVNLIEMDELTQLS